MVRGRKPQATAIKVASGAFQKDPQRRNHDEPIAKLGEPEMPEAVASDETAKKRWVWVCEQLKSMNLLHQTDQGLIAGYCLDYSMMLSLWEEIKGGNVSYVNAKGSMSVKPQATQFNTFSDRILKREAELGLTPSARTRLRAPQKDEEDPFQEWLARATG